MYLFFDTETTGLPRNWKASVKDVNNWPRLVQIAWLEYNKDSKLIDTKDFIIKPDGFTIPTFSEKIHGISTEKALKEGKEIKTVLKEFSEAMDRAQLLIAHNINFDTKVAGAEFIRANLKSRLFKINKICTMEESTEYCRLPGNYGYKWPNLSELYNCLFDDDFKEAHNALNDVQACAKSFFRLKKLGQIDPRYFQKTD